jgi:N-terminal acetyltransferase B complex catalytic subunit
MGKSEGEGCEWHGHVTALTVAPDYRRMGIGQRLMEHLEDVSEAGDMFFVDLFVRQSNINACRMYEKLGYKTFRRVVGYYTGLNPEDALDMRKPLPRDSEGKSLQTNKPVILVDELYPD